MRGVLPPRLWFGALCLLVLLPPSQEFSWFNVTSPPSLAGSVQFQIARQSASYINDTEGQLSVPFGTTPSDKAGCSLSGLTFDSGALDQVLYPQWNVTMGDLYARMNNSILLLAAPRALCDLGLVLVSAESFGVAGVVVYGSGGCAHHDVIEYIECFETVSWNDDSAPMPVYVIDERRETALLAAVEHNRTSNNGTGLGIVVSMIGAAAPGGAASNTTERAAIQENLGNLDVRQRNTLYMHQTPSPRGYTNMRAVTDYAGSDDLCVNRLEGLYCEYGSIVAINWQSVRTTAYTGLTANMSALSELRMLNASATTILNLFGVPFGHPFWEGQIDLWDLLVTWPKLRYLNFEDSYLWGYMPDRFHQISPHLEYFNVGYNFMQLGLPSSLTQMSSLRVLRSRLDGLTGTLPTNWTAMQSLEYVSLPYQNFYGALPCSLVGLPNLKVIDISHNGVEQFNCSGVYSPIRKLYLTRNPLNIIPVDTLDEAPFLTTLFVGYLVPNGGTLMLPAARNATQLDVVQGQDSAFTGVIPAAYRNARILFLAGNALVGIEDNLWNFPRVEELNINTNQIQGSFSNSSSFPRLVTGIFSKNRLTGTIPAGVFNSSQLQKVDLSQNQLSGQLPADVFVGAANLVEIRLQRNAFTDTLPLFTSQTTELTLLDLSYNNFTGRIPNDWSKLDGLDKLQLSHNEVQMPEEPNTLKNMAVLRSLHLDDNAVNFPIPGSSGGKDSAQTIDSFFNTYFPTRLVTLNLASNNITGPWKKIEDDYWNLLETLILNDNGFTAVPSNIFTELYNLKELNLRNNNLQGIVPLVHDPQTIQFLDILDVRGNPYFGLWNISGNRGPPSDERDTKFYSLYNNSAHWFVPDLNATKRSSSCDSATESSATLTCYPIVPRFGLDLKLLVDPSYFGFYHCECEAGMFGKVPCCREMPTFVTLGSNGSVVGLDTTIEHILCQDDAELPDTGLADSIFGGAARRMTGMDLVFNLAPSSSPGALVSDASFLPGVQGDSLQKSSRQGASAVRRLTAQRTAGSGVSEDAGVESAHRREVRRKLREWFGGSRERDDEDSPKIAAKRAQQTLGRTASQSGDWTLQALPVTAAVSSAPPMAVFINMVLFRQHWDDFTDVLSVHVGGHDLKGAIVHSMRGIDDPPATEVTGAGFGVLTEVQNHPDNVTLNLIVFSDEVSINFRTRDLTGHHFTGSYEFMQTCPLGYEAVDASEGRPTCKLEPEVEEFSSSIQGTLITIGIIVCLFVLACIVGFYKYRSTVVFKAASVRFCGLLLLFDFIMGMGVIFWGLDPKDGDHVCSLRYWFFGVGFVGLMSSLLVKMHRIYLIFKNVNRLRTAKLPDSSILKWLLSMLLCIFGFMIAYSAVPLQRAKALLNDDGKLEYQCTATSAYQSYLPVGAPDFGIRPSSEQLEDTSGEFTVWMVCLVLFISAFVAWGFFLACKTRNAPSAFQETNSIMYINLVIAIFLVCIVPALIVSRDSPQVTVLLSGLMQAVLTLMVIVVLFAPKFYYVYIGQGDNKERTQLESSARGVSGSSRLGGSRFSSESQREASYASSSTHEGERKQRSRGVMPGHRYSDKTYRTTNPRVKYSAPVDELSDDGSDPSSDAEGALQDRSMSLGGEEVPGRSRTMTKAQLDKAWMRGDSSAAEPVKHSHSINTRGNTVLLAGETSWPLPKDSAGDAPISESNRNIPQDFTTATATTSSSNSADHSSEKPRMNEVVSDNVPHYLASMPRGQVYEVPYDDALYSDEEITASD